ncbi:MAG: AmmeMemoRadiSam system radical SAM enzyme [Clostridia bacterium]|nr:AmmeMemoRadiSam system radical SAM enzyme [Clostridia bacterium]
MAGHPAMFFEETGGGDVLCALCPQSCALKAGQTGLCLARANDAGRLVSLNYGRVSALALDPIEKKPLRRFFPGSMILSAGSFGCNFKCRFCQNWSISQQEPPLRELTAQQLARLARETVPDGNIGLAFTYNEPLVWFEFVYDCARLNREQGLRNVLVTNGYVNPGPMAELLPYIDAMNIDLKAFSPGFYRSVCSGRLEPVMETIAQCAAACHVEVTTLLIPGLNDSAQEVAALAKWLAGISPELPLHLTRYHPDYRMTAPPQPGREQIFELAGLARQSLRYVYCGNC